VPEQTLTDDELLERAQQIKADRGCSLAEAMDIAQGQAAKAASGVDTTFHITLELKPRVARFFRQSFDGHPTMSVEERMAKFLEIQLNKLRGQALAQPRIEATEATEGEARTIRRSVFLQNHG
jgi:hypothetical protein